MKTQTEVNLRKAKSALSSCAHQILQTQPLLANLTNDQREMLTGFGIAADWVRWAGSLDELRFVHRSERRSDRKDSMCEVTRFSYMWTATNALFARDSIVAIAGGLMSLAQNGSELSRFQILWDFAGLPSDVVQRETVLLNKILGMECKADDVRPFHPSLNPTMWEVIQYKYITPHQRKMRIGRAISEAIEAKSVPYLPAPMIIYGARNWNVHGVLTTRVFRGTIKKYETFINSIQLLLSEVLARSGANLLARI